MRDNGAHVRVLGIAAKQPAGLHHLMAGFMNRRRPVVNRAHDGEAVGQLGQERKNFRWSQLSLTKPVTPCQHLLFVAYKRLWNLSMARANIARPMLHKTTEWTQSSAQPAPRRMTPRAASISQVVGNTCATYQKA